MRTNPFKILPPKVRAWIYFIATLVALAAAAVQASHGDWLQAVVLLAGSLTGGLAGSNVKE